MIAKTDRQLRALVLTPVILYSDLDTYERMAVGALAMNGVVSFVSIKNIASMMGCSYRKAARTLVSLKRKGWLNITARRNAEGDKDHNRYDLSPVLSDGVVGGYGNLDRTPPAIWTGRVLPTVPISETSSGSFREENKSTAGLRRPGGKNHPTPTPTRKGPAPISQAAQEQLERFARVMANHKNPITV